MIGAWGALRRTQSTPLVDEVSGGPPPRRAVAVALLTSATAAYFLALGNQGPTGSAFHWAYDHVPFFQVMREPQKFAMLVVLAYAVCLGWGIDYLLGAWRPSGGASLKRAGPVIGLAGLVLALAYCPTMFWGLAGQLTPTTVPASYGVVDQVMGVGPGQVLYLPWHLYMEYPFTGRVVANLGPTSFRRGVISGDNAQVGPGQSQSSSARSTYIEALLSAGD